MNRMKQTVWKKTPYVRERFSNFRKKHMLPIKPAFPIKDTRARDPYFLAMERRVEEFVQEEHDYEEMMKDVYERRAPPPPNTPHPGTLLKKDAAVAVEGLSRKDEGISRKDEGVAKILSINNEGAAEVLSRKDGGVAVILSNKEGAEGSRLWTDEQIHIACVQLKHPFL